MKKAPYYNIITTISGRIIDNILTVIFFSFAARSLGVLSFGTYTLTFSIAIIFFVTSDFGFSRFSIRELAMSKDISYNSFGSIMLTYISFSLTLAVLFTTILFFVLSKSEWLYTIFFIMSYSIWGIGDFYLNLFRAHENFLYPVFITLIQKIIFYLVAFFGLWKGFGFSWLIGSHILSSIIFLILALSTSSKQFIGNINYHLNWKRTKDIFKKIFPYGIINVLGVIHFRLVIYLIPLFTNKAGVGFFGASHRLVEGLVFFAIAIGSTSFPNFVNSYHKSKEQLSNGVSTIFKILFIFIFPVALATTIFSKEIILLFYGEEFKQSIPILQILIWSCFLIYFNTLFVTVLQAVKQLKLISYFLLCSILVQIIVSYFAITFYEVRGAAIVSLIGEIFMFCSLLYVVSKFIDMKNVFYNCWKPLFISIFMVICIYNMNNIHFILQIFFGATIYIVIIVYLFPFTKKEKNWLIRKTLK